MSLKNIVIGIAIMILTIVVVVNGFNTFYSAPAYEDFCSTQRPAYPYLGTAKVSPEDNETICPAVCVKMWEIERDLGECAFNECGSGCGPDGVETFETLKQCETALSGKNCFDVYEDARESYSRNLFLMALPIGILIIVIGTIVFGLESVGAGLMAGGVGVILWGVGGFWRFADDWLKFLLSLIGLVVLIWLAYYFNERLGKKGKKKGKKKGRKKSRK